MDNSTKRRLILGFVSSWVSKLASTIIQLVQVPFFLHFWRLQVYGNWLIIISIPQYLSFSNLGFGTAAGNEMTMAEAREDRETSLRVFQSCWWLIIIIMLFTGLFVSLALTLVPVTRLLGIHFISESDVRWIVAYLGVAVLLGQLEELLQAAYRSIGRNPYGSFINSCMNLGAFSAMLLPVGLGYGPRTTALVYACAEVLGTVVLALMVKHDIPWIHFGWRHARISEIKRLTFPAIAFLGFPLGNALNIQGTLLAVSYALGPVAVVVFSTARTVSRVALQMVQMVNGTFEPEFSRSFAQNDSELLRTLHRRACQLAMAISLLIVSAMTIGGPFFLNHWTRGRVPPSRGLLTILLMVVIVYSLWSTSSGIMYATNRHKKLSAVYIGATGITVLVTFAAAHFFGLYGAAASLLISELLMTLYVLPASLEIVHDTVPGFVGSFRTMPVKISPRALLRRLRRSRPALETL